MRMRDKLAGAVLMAVLASTPIAAAEIPVPTRGPVTTNYFGVEVADPYRALEDVGAPETRAWVDAQAAAARDRLLSLPGRQTLLAEYAAIDAKQRPTIGSLQRSARGTLFYLERRFGETNNRLLARVPGRSAKPLSDGADDIVVFAPSPDGRRVIVVVLRNGTATLLLIDGSTGAQSLVAEDVWRGATPCWMPDGRGFYYIAKGPDQANASAMSDAPLRMRSLRFDHHEARTIVGWESVYAPGDTLALNASDDGRMLFVSSRDRTSRSLSVVSAQVGGDEMAWFPLIDRAAGVEAIALHGRHLYARTMANATLGRIVRYDAEYPTRAPVEVVAGADDGVLQELTTAADGLYFTVRKGYDMRLAKWPYGGRPGHAYWIALPYAGTIKSLAGRSTHDGVVFGLEGWTHPSTFFRAHAARASTLALQAPPSATGHDWVSENLVCRSPDGVDISMVAVHRKDMKKDGSNPLILNGYGGYGFVESAYFYPKSDPWIQRGGVFVDFMPRGSGATGEAWHRAGMGPNKPNSWKDLITCAETLIADGYTSHDRLITQGVAIGGLMIGRAMTERPDLFAATVIRWGVTDPLRFVESSAHLPADELEYGRPDSAAGVSQLLDQSVDGHIRDGLRYPAVMLTTGLKDASFPPWLSFKTAARLANIRATPDRPVLLRVDPDGGARIPMSPTQRNEELADRIAFMLWIVGNPEFQPKH